MNNRGQALVEFVIILPIFMLIFIMIIDFGMIFNTKNELENNSVDIALLIKNDVSINLINEKYDDIKISVENNDEYLIVSLEKDVDINTPGLNRIFGDKYSVRVERTIYNDKT